VELCWVVEGAGRSRTMEAADRWEEIMARESEVSMKMMAAAVVSLARKVVVPRVPKMVWLAPLPKALPIWAPLPVCSNTTKIKKKHIIRCRMASARYISSSYEAAFFPDGRLDDRDE